MQPGEWVGERFELEREVGRGGMGCVFTAADRETGARIALKILTEPGPRAAERFAVEADALRRLSHPGIVRYVAHGADPVGPWIAMEWIEGDTLSARMDRGRLTVPATLALARRLADALAVAHAAGVVHRDVKPSNLLLPGGRLEDVVLVDFGIARVPAIDRIATAPGIIVGTPGYMAPEQVRSAGDLGPPADLFALGVVLWECLAGRRLFVGATPLAEALRVMIETPPRLREEVFEVPAALEELVAGLLAKDPHDRPADGAALRTLLDGLVSETEQARHPAPMRVSDPGALTTGELRFLAIVLARSPPPELPWSDQTIRAPPPEELGALVDRLALRASDLGATLDRLADGSLVAVVGGEVTPAELAVRAARLAELVLESLPGWWVVVTTGRGDPAGEVPVGEAVERAVAMQSDGTAVAIDDLTAELLEGRYVLERRPDAIRLLRPAAVVDAARPILGRSTPFLGRDSEMAALRDVHERCAAHSTAQAVWVVGAPGWGKSRLRRELVRSLPGQALVLLGHGDPLRREAPLSVVADLARRALGLHDGIAPASLRERLGEALRRTSGGAAVAHATELFAEILGAPVPDGEASEELLAARRNPGLLGDRMRDAFVDWIGRACDVAPVIVTLEDLQWVDPSSLRYVRAAAGTLRDKPLMVLGLARPEWWEDWDEVTVTRIDLKPIDRSSSEALARAILGPEASPVSVAQVAEQSEGHPLLLEELARSIGSDGSQAASATVLGLVEHRLASQTASQRRILRAASVIGTRFWRGAVAELVGTTEGLDADLGQLCSAEILLRSRGSRVADEREYRFRHDLFREASYQTLTAEDRTRGHRVAGRWLEQRGEADAGLLAEHYTRGHDAARAALAHFRAARRALAAGDAESALGHASKGRDLEADRSRRGELAAVMAEALLWLGRLGEAANVGWDALDELAEGSPPWYAAAANQAGALSRLRATDDAHRLVELVLKADPKDGVAAALARARVAERILRLDLDAQADQVLALLEEHALDPEPAAHPLVRAMIRFAQAARHSWHGRVDKAIEGFRWAQGRFADLGERRPRLEAGLQLLGELMSAGLFEEAWQALEQTRALATEAGARPLVAFCLLKQGELLGAEGRTQKAIPLVEQACPIFEEMGDDNLAGFGHAELARYYGRLGDLERARTEADRAIRLMRGPQVLEALAVRSRLRTLGDPAGALEDAEKAMQSVGPGSSFAWGEAEAGTAMAIALSALGRTEEAHAAIREARARVERRAARIADPETRRAFLERVPPNARVLALAAEWLGGDG